MFTAKQVEMLLEKERAKKTLLPPLPATPTPPTSTDARGHVPAQGLRSFGELDAAGQSALRASAQLWVKGRRGRGGSTSRKSGVIDQAGVGEPGTILSRSLYNYAALKNVPTSLMEKLVKTYCESRYVTLTSVWHAVSDLVVRTR
jgi:hypothetical protein